MDRNHTLQQRELVYCHQCENEWYRDEHGIICPECDSDFTEIIEENHDPREGEEAPHPFNFGAPDPDEDDIDAVHWQQSGQRNFEGWQGQQETYPGGTLTGMLGAALQSFLGGQPPRDRGPQSPPGPDDQARNHPDTPGFQDHYQQQQQQQQQQQRGHNGTFVRQGHGPGFSYTIMTSSNGPTLSPRNANGPQPFQGQPDHLEHMIGQMIMNIGVNPGRQFHGVRAPGGAGAPFIMGLGGSGFAGGGHVHTPFGDVFHLLGMPHGGAAGDAVYSQEALDRIISQLMEQHQSGNAPPPASNEAIESLPQRPITKQDAGDSGKADCSICMDEAEIGSMVTQLPCGHWFHHDCIKAWLTEHDTCPHCRQGIMPKDQPNNSRARQASEAPHHDMQSPEYHQRMEVPGAYPFPRQDSSQPEDGRPGATRQNPVTIPDSPERWRGGNSSSGSSMFSRMREAFSPGGSNSRRFGNQDHDRSSGHQDRS